jgi:hypothetical protein
MDLMLPGEQEVWFKRYNPSIHTWSKVLVGHIITLKAGKHIFLKGYNVNNCQDFDCLHTASQVSKPHFSKNLSHEHASVWQALKEKRVWKAGRIMSNDGETEEDQAQASSKIMPWPLMLPWQFKVEPSDFALGLVASDRDSTSHHMAEPTFIDLMMSDAEDAMPAPTKRRCAHFLPSPSPSPSVLTPCSSPNETEESSDDGPPAWPAVFYVVNIVQGFERCDEAHLEQRSVQKAFFKCFKVPFWSMTFYNHHWNWDNASAASQDAALCAGHTSDGLWTTFLKRSHAEVDKKRKKRRVLN